MVKAHEDGSGVLDTRRATCSDLKNVGEVYLQVFKINFRKIELKELLAYVAENKVFCFLFSLKL